MNIEMFIEHAVYDRLNRVPTLWEETLTPFYLAKI